MLLYIVRRILMLVPILVLMSMVAFFLIQLPPGDYVSFRIQQLKMSGVEVSEDEAARLMMQFGLDKPVYVQYLRWMEGIFRGRLPPLTFSPERRPREANSSSFLPLLRKRAV